MSKCGNCCYGVMTGPNRMFCSAQNCFCEEVFYCEDYEPIVKPITNADRIRGMTDEELAEFLLDIDVKANNYGYEAADGEPGEYPLPEDWLAWLKQGVE